MHKVVNIGVLTSSMLTFAHLSPVSAQQGAGVVTDKMLEDTVSMLNSGTGGAIIWVVLLPA